MLSCAPNFRDIGGSSTSDDRQVRAGMIYRAEAFALADPADAAALEAIGIRAVLDVRSERERAHLAGHWLDAPVASHWVQVTADPRAPSTSLDLLRATPGAVGARDFMLHVYGQLPTNCMPAVERLFELIASDALPLLVHCTAGKDRTGFLIATLLGALGVAPEAVIADYLATAGRLSLATVDATRNAIDSRLQIPLTPDALDTILGVEPAYLDASNDAIAGAHGSLEAYLAACGVGPALLASVRDRLLG